MEGWIGGNDVFINGSFETGDFTGWDVSTDDPGKNDVVTDYTSDGAGSETNLNYDPVDGSYFARLEAAAEDVWQKISQEVWLPEGATVSGYAAFDARDYMNFNDEARVYIDGVEVWFENVDGVGDWNQTDWEYWEWTAPADGYYTIEIGVRNINDGVNHSRVLIDDIKADL